MLKRALLVCGLMLAPLAHAFDLPQLAAQLGKPAVVRGEFVQEKHLRSLPQPLVSKGHFVLAKQHGLLWLLQTPLKQDYRIDDKGIARRDASGWQQLPQRSASAQQNRLFLAVLEGDSSGLQRDFDLALSGESNDWKLTLTPRAVLLKQIFDSIEIAGGELVQRIELHEAQGDRTVLRMTSSQPGDSLTEAERADFAR
ncbi:outer membrane lipoprotein carrier protein LolA [Pseudomonas sp. NY15435]|uniref:outer membrane lipoprotein carrier protein LolA n=1 Tax=Pseudomonas sp. NY15435 TaxID=3400358 RepID=UPI003A86DCEC